MCHDAHLEEVEDLLSEEILVACQLWISHGVLPVIPGIVVNLLVLTEQGVQHFSEFDTLVTGDMQSFLHEVATVSSVHYKL